MTIYKKRPTQRRAKKVWDYITKKRGKEPISLHKNPNCWMKPQVVGNAWGWWVAEFTVGINMYPYENIHPKDVERKK